MEFLPENYTPPQQGGHYLKLQQGVTVLRILSRPIVGWEMWHNGHPKRYPSDQKPEATEESIPKEFWSMIVWNKEAAKVQIWHVTQNSVKKQLMALVQDPDWGSPHQYDIKVTRAGQQLKTTYDVTPTPKSALSEDVKTAFKESGIWLDALYTNDDPFAEWTHVTSILGGEESSESISKAQYEEIVGLIGDDKEYLQRVEDGLKKTYETGLKSLPVKHYQTVLRQVQAWASERVKKELDDALPF